METQTVKQLREIAKQRGLRLYSKLRKAELITMLIPMLNQPCAGEAVGGMQNLLDEPVPNIGVSVLQPTTASKTKFFRRVKESLSVLGNKIKSETNTFADWLISYVPEPIKKQKGKQKG